MLHDVTDIYETVHEENKHYSKQNVVVYSISPVLLNRYTAKKADCLWYSKRWLPEGAVQTEWTFAPRDYWAQLVSKAAVQPYAEVHSMVLYTDSSSSFRHPQVWNKYVGIAMAFFHILCGWSIAFSGMFVAIVALKLPKPVIFGVANATQGSVRRLQKDINLVCVNLRPWISGTSENQWSLVKTTIPLYEGKSKSKIKFLLFSSNFSQPLKKTHTHTHVRLHMYTHSHIPAHTCSHTHTHSLKYHKAQQQPLVVNMVVAIDKLGTCTYIFSLVLIP